MKNIKTFEEYQSPTRIKTYDGKHRPFPTVGSEKSIPSAEGYTVKDKIVIDGEEAEIFEIIQRTINNEPDYWYKIIFDDGTEDVVQSSRFDTKINESYDMSYFTPMAKWIQSVWDRLQDVPDAEMMAFWEKLEEEIGEQNAEIIDYSWSEDRLHYYQNDKAKDFIENFDSIKETTDELLNNL